MVALTQEGRLIGITTPLGADELVLNGFSGTESISRPFCFRVDMLSLNHNLKANDILGKTVDIRLTMSSGDIRYFNAYVSQFVAGERRNGGYRSYQAELVPWFSLLRLYSDCKIFQALKADEIIKAVFSARGFSDFELQVSGQLKEREYTVQYRETDFQFISRLMEEEGMFYFFKHEEGRHIMVIGDSTSVYGECVEGEARYVEAADYDDRLNQWSNQASLVSGKWSQKDYNFETPSTDIFSTVSTILDTPGIDKFEQYDYPGLYQKRAEGDVLTRIRMEEEEAHHNIVTSAGNYRSFFAGGKFTVSEHVMESEQDKSYVITSITHNIREKNYEMGMSGGFEYSNDFQCIPDSVSFRPPQVTRKPFVQGPQTALVVGPSG
ncbi:MAG: type VI secretion system tip protein VgrG, partial [Gammaproteobacteria bacterium]|nr:type VI secretion system tip protein VgrG [Gammaproteobacteria bacterium]